MHTQKQKKPRTVFPEKWTKKEFEKKYGLYCKESPMKIEKINQ